MTTEKMSDLFCNYIDQLALESEKPCISCKGKKTIEIYNTPEFYQAVCCRCGGSGLEASEFGKKLIQFLHRRRSFEFQGEVKDAAS